VHLSVESRRSLDDLVEGLRAALATHGFRVAATTDARDPLAASGRSGRGSLVLEVEDPLPGVRVGKDGGPADGTTWKVAAYETGRGTTRLSTIRPTHLVELLGHPELAHAAERVEHDLEAVLHEAAGRERESES
jgi:uncharacterized protein (DUF302 family)